MCRRWRFLDRIQDTAATSDWINCISPGWSNAKAATSRQVSAPSHPHHRPFREYEVLGNRVENFASAARPIHIFYSLEAGEPDSEIHISELDGFRKFEELVPNYLYGFHFRQARRLQWLGQLAHCARVFRVCRPWNLERQDEVYAAICAHSRSV